MKSLRNINIDFYGKRRLFLGISVALILIGLVCTFIFGVKLDVQFAGGSVIKYSVDGEVDQNEIQKIVSDATGKEVSVVSNKLIATDENQVTVSFAGNQAISLEEQQKVAQVLSDSYADRTFKVVSSSSVDPTMGSKFFQKCMVCFGITVILLLAYIAFRFRRIGGVSAGLTAILALVHDVLIIFFVFIVMGMKINDIFIAVVLTLLGYSLNDTIVIYDRIRENERLMGSKADLATVMNRSLNQVFARSVYTSVTTFLALLVISIVSTIYGLTTVQSFSVPMLVGVVAGCYSSLFIAAPLYTMWQIHKSKKAKK